VWLAQTQTNNRSGQNRQRASRVALLATCSLLAALAFGVSEASALVIHRYTCQITGTSPGSATECHSGGSATPAGAMTTSGLAVDLSGSSSDGDVYVVDAKHGVVNQFSPSGAYLCQITGQPSATTTSPSECANKNNVASPGTPQGGFGQLSGPIAVDPATGNVWVADAAAEMIDEFSPSGVYLSQFAVPDHLTGALAVDATTGDVYVADENFNTVLRFDPVTSALTTFASSTPSGPLSVRGGLAVDNSGGSGAGDVYIIDGTVIDVFSSAGTYLSKLTGTPSGAFSSPNRLAVDSATGDLFVADSDFFTPTSSVIDQFDSSGNFIGMTQASQTPAGSFFATGLAIVPSGGVYISDSSQGVVDEFGPGVVIPDVATDPASAIGATSATLNGTVNADGTAISDCHFAYVDAADYNTALPNPYSAGQTVPCTPTPSGSSPTSVSAALTGLAPGTTYHVQLFAANSNGTNSGGDLTFQTLPPPSIDSATTTGVTAATAALSAGINPNGYDTTYQFQWGTSKAYGNDVPAAPADIGAGTSDVPVSASLSGLTADTEYHWRVVATNANGTTTGADHSFVYDTTAQGLPDDRAYEQVTPVQKNGAAISAFFAAPTDFSADGSRVIDSSVQCFANAGSCNGSRGEVGSPYEFKRTASGWQASAMSPPASMSEGGVTPLEISADADTSLFEMPTAPGGEDDLYAGNADGSFPDIGPLYPPADGALGQQGAVVGATADLSHVVFALGTGTFWPFDTTFSSSSENSLYEYSGTGNAQPALVGVRGGAGSTSLISVCGTELGAGDATTTPGRMSADGSIVFFTALGSDDLNCGGAEPATDNLYARINGSQTVLLSGPSPNDCTGSCASAPPGDANFEGASSDGSKAFFISTQQLTNAASEDSHSGDAARNSGCAQTTGANGCNLYLYDFANPTGANLIDVSAGDTSGLGPEVQGVMAIAGDGSHVYFVAKGVLTTSANDQGQTAQAGADNLYAYERDAANPSGRLAFVAQLPAAERQEWDGSLGDVANVTPDGRFLVFTSGGDLTADDSSAGVQQVFRYDDQTGQLERVSIGSHGFNDNGNLSGSGCTPIGPCQQDASIVPSGRFAQRAGVARTDPTMSDDGTRVFFQSPIGLTRNAIDDVQIGTDANGVPTYAQNIYEWEQGGVGSCPATQAQGCVFLISDGRDTGTFRNVSDVRLGAADTTGDNVFFTTSDSLVAQDTDTELDWYDARVGGGFPPSLPPPPCQGDLCQGTSSAPPPPVTVGTVTFTGPGNTTPSGRPKLRMLSRAVHGSTFFIRVNVPGAGRISVTGRGIRAVRRSVSKARSYRLRVRLSSRQAKAVARGRTLRLRLRVAYSSARRGRSITTVPLRVTAASHRTRGDRTRRTNSRRGGAR
jgi:hypothetical protein